MTRRRPPRRSPSDRPTLGLFRPDAPAAPAEGMTCEYKINGHTGRIHVWNPDQWAQLASKPDDASPLPDGSWTTLRMA